MGRILAIDYGTKKSGIAVTDPLQIIVSGLETIDTEGLKNFLQGYVVAESVEKIVLGYPLYPDGNPAQLAAKIKEVGVWLSRLFPSVAIDYQDESYTSMEAKRIIEESGLSKKKRKDKRLVDKISAILILQTYLHHI